MADLPQGYRDIPEEDRKKARVFFDRGKTVADTGNYEYAIEMYIQGLSIDPEDTEAHKALREISLKRKASGKKDMGMFERRKYPTSTKDDKQNMLNAEKLLAYEPGDTDRMVQLFKSAHKAGFYDTVLWIGPILQKANTDSKSPDFHKYILLKDIYKSIDEFSLATEACHYARTLRPDDMDLNTELKNLAAQQTMKGGKYGTAKSFRESMRDKEKQQDLIESDKDVHTVDVLVRGVKNAEADFATSPEDPAKLTKLVEALTRTEQTEYEQRAIDLLTEAYERTGQFKWRQRVGAIKVAQFSRQERSLRTQWQADPKNPEVIQKYREFKVQRASAELEEYKLILEHYPTDSGARFQVAARLFELKNYQEAIPILQQVRSDPKYRIHAGTLLGKAFLQAGFPDEGVDTLKAVIDEYPNKGDEKSREMFYFYGLGLEEKKDSAAAIKVYSQLAQWEFNYRDVQARIKRLRAGGSNDAGGDVSDDPGVTD